MRTRLTTLLGLASFVFVAHASAGLAAAADPQTPTCSNATLSGTFAFTARGTTTTASPVPAPLQGAFASSGSASFDGAGHFSLTATSSFNGLVQPPGTVTGTYAVNPDCSYTSVASNGVTFQAVIVDGGRELLILQTTPGVIVTGMSERVDGRGAGRSNAGGGCDKALTRGVYGFLAEGVAGPPTIPAAAAGPLAGVGTVRFDRDGSFLLQARRSVNGTLDPQVLPLTGTYTFTGPCSFTMAFDVGFTFAATVADDGRQVVFVETDPGTTLIVRARKI